MSAVSRPTLRVLFDSQIGFEPAARGIHRSFAETVRALRADRGLGIRVRAPWARSPDRRTRFAHRMDDSVLPRLQHDIVHHTYYSPTWLGKYPARHIVSTVHDMIPELMPELFPRGNPHRAKAEYVAASDLLVCPSSATRDDLLRLFPAITARTVVVPHGVGAPFRGRGRVPRPEGSGRTDGSVLFVGTRAGYKDFPLAVEALARAVRTSAAVPRRLVVVGAPPEPEERALVARLAPEVDVTWTGADDRELAEHYHRATALLFPSRSEGFGLPTLEAMACGCAVVLPDTSSHPEVAGDAGWYFPVGDAEACAAALVRLVEDPEERERRRRIGLERAEGMTWSASARLLADAYRALDGTT